MTTVKDFKSFLKALINSNRRKSGKTAGLSVRDIKKDLLYHENIDVDKFVTENGHRDLLDLINEWEDFTIHYNANEPIVRVKCEDHISQMNKYSKHARGSINSIAKDINSQRLKVILGPDPYSFSPDSSLNAFYGQNLPEYPPKEASSSLDSDDIFDDFDFINEILDSNSKKGTDETAHSNKLIQETLTNENPDLPNKKLNQVLTQLKIPRPLNMMPTPTPLKSISKGSVMHQSQVRQTPRQKLSFFKNVNSPKIPYKIVKTIDQLIPSCKMLDLNTKSVLSIALLDVANPHRFWFAEYNEYKALTELMKNMQEFYTTNQDLLRINAQDLQRGLYVAALFDGIWHRAMIIKKDENFARISYVDFGNADDLAHINLCYLKQDFLNLPSIARRGVLACIQPAENDEWSVKSTSFFESCIKNKKVAIKIFKHNPRDNSYCLGIKHKNEQKAVELLTNSMITNNLARPDLKFFENEIVSKDSYGFQEYEEGILLDIKPEISNAIEAFDSWMPFDCSTTPVQVTKRINASTPLSISSTTNDKRSASIAFSTPTKVDPPVNASAIKVYEEVKRNLTNEFNNAAEQNEKQVETIKDTLEQITTRQASSNTIFQVDQSRPGVNLSNSVVIPKQVIKECPNIVRKQSFEKLIIGQQIEIFIHVFYDTHCFFFYIKNEMAEIKKFLDDVNKNCKENKECLSDEELIVNKEVVIKFDENFCRGRINSKIENSYQVFLIDFGIFATRKREEIYRLQKEFTKRQSCIYKGSTRETFSIEGQVKSFIVAKILGIRNEDTVDLKIEALNNLIKKN